MSIQIGGCELYHGDCLDIMPTLPTVDMVLCDLPYGHTGCAWDVVVPIAPLWEQYKALIKPNNAIVLFGKNPFSAKLIIGNMDWFKYNWVWKKSTPTGVAHSKNRPMLSHEDILVFSGGVTNHASLTKNRMPYNPQGLKACELVKANSVRRGRSTGGINPSAGGVNMHPSSQSTYKQTQTNYPRTVLEFSNGNHNSQHPTQKPTVLLEYLIRTYTNEGDIVLDNTMGSGSTGVACINTNRRFIGIEKDDVFFDIAYERIAKAHNERDKTEGMPA